MEKQKRWQLFLILGVVLLTVYNILPTVFYYAKPLKSPIDQKESVEIAKGIVERVNSLEDFDLAWTKSQVKNLGLKAKSIEFSKQDPRLISVTFNTPEESAFFSKTLDRAGALIPFAPAQLSPDARSFEEGSNVAYIQRRIGVHLPEDKLNEFFHFIPKQAANGDVSPEYKTIITDRAAEIALGFGGTSEPGAILARLAAGDPKESENEYLLRLSRSIVDYENAFGDSSPITKRYYASFTQVDSKSSKDTLVSTFVARLERLSTSLQTKANALKEEQEKRKADSKFLSTDEQQKLETYESQKGTVGAALAIVKRNLETFGAGQTPLTSDQIAKTLESGKGTLSFEGRSPFIEKMVLDWKNDAVTLVPYADVTKLREQKQQTEKVSLQVEKLNQLLFNEVAAVTRYSDEAIVPGQSNFNVKLSRLAGSTSLLALDLKALAALEVETVNNLVKSSWQRGLSGDLTAENFPLYDYETYKTLSPEKQALGLVVYSPTTSDTTLEGFRKGSIYVIGKGMGALLNKSRSLPDGKEKSSLDASFRSLALLMRQNGFIGYYGADSGLPAEYKNDFIFELDDYYSYLIAASREDFSVKGSKQYAVLEFTDVEQRLLTLNKIETRIHEDLVRWHDEYSAAQVNINPQAKFDVPKPTQNAFISNFMLSAAKYFRGDDRKILKWGLDLSGGKTVRVGLKNHNNEPITNPDDLRQAVNEIYQRVNRLGVSEVGIRVEGSSIVLDFPGSQGLSAAELIQASAMYFHVVNEKFTPNNQALAEASNTFLEEVWNEAVITGKKDEASINELAWQHLGGNAQNPSEFHPLTSHAKLLYDNGLRLAGPKSPAKSGSFDDTLSQVAIFRGTDYTQWQGQTHPLIIVFHNYALEGANLENVQTGYDANEGNMLFFGVQGSYTAKDGEKVNPRDEFYSWTSQFAEDKIGGTPKEHYSQGRGWRMAVILNGTVINAPTLNSALRDSARISGHFSQREVNQLAADLKAGSLSFTPQILSEENVSPELGKEQRNQGIFAAFIGLVLVLGVMIAYYRFGGIVASVAVLFNLLIMWGVLQNLGAALTLPGLAGIILTVAMAVDANVLVFERVREEYEVSKRLASAIAAGYRKAFTAIVDSNLTTIIAALILLNFDAGPVKGLALTLIIGIISSMFTSLFMTRYFFAGWVQNPEHKTLNMARMFGKTSFDFLSKAKIAIVASIAVIAIGGMFFVSQHKTLFGMDFTGGYSLTLDLAEKPSTDYRLAAEDALLKAGAAREDFQIRELSKPTALRVQLGTGMEQPGKPFANLSKSVAAEKSLFPYQDNPRIVWLVDALAKEGLTLNPASLSTLNLSWTEMSGQLSDAMRNNALIGLGLALLCILIYITFRFEFKYAVSATIGLVHDLLITVGIIALIHSFYPALQIDLQVIAALLTIIGYSLNDTIIIFDRIREDIKLMRKLTFREIINHALNATLSRTVMTSGTTLLVLLALVMFGGHTLFNFSLVMTIGVAVGTLSSLFVAAPLLLYFHNREVAQHEEQKTLKSS